MDGPLTRNQTRTFFLVAVLLFLLPFILADFPYVDDNWRAQLTGQDAWRFQGRILTEWFYRLMTFSGRTLDVFPLPLLVAAGLMALALADLTRHYFATPTLSRCLVVLPLWFSPFWLGNLTYQYDGPGMSIGVVAVIYSVVYRSPNRVLRVLVPGALLAASCAFYQVNMNVFIGLCCVELIRAVHEKTTAKAVATLLGFQLAQWVTGVFIYGISALQLTQDERQTLLPFAADSLSEMASRVGVTLHTIGLFVTPGTAWMWGLLALTAAVGYARGGFGLLRRRGNSVSMELTIYLGALPVLVLSILGILGLLADFALEARTLTGFAPVLVLMFYFSQHLLERLHPRLGLLLAVPLLCMLSMSYVYGRVLTAQKTFERTFVDALRYDLTSRPELRDLRTFYWFGGDLDDTWLPAANVTLEQMPALSFLLGLTPGDFAVPDHLADLGVQRAYAPQFPVSRGAMIKVVESRFYDIWVADGSGYVVTKPAGKP